MSGKKQNVHEFSDTSVPIGVGIIDLRQPRRTASGASILLSESAELFSQSVAREQGFKADYDDDKATYTLTKNITTALQAPVRAKCGL
ncbi:hypothetical protein PInf_021053 [Phytophthora infestans]|nr:hypothetical protein PInf_021053 [Phytophthora infestans]